MLDDQVRLDLHVEEITKALTKCTGKHKRHVLRGGAGRLYPRLIGDVMLDTTSYVKVFFELNKTSKHAAPFDYRAFFEPLSTRPQEWPEEPLFEAIEGDSYPPSQYDMEATVAVPAWLKALGESA